MAISADISVEELSGMTPEDVGRPDPNVEQDSNEPNIPTGTEGEGSSSDSSPAAPESGDLGDSLAAPSVNGNGEGEAQNQTPASNEDYLLDLAGELGADGLSRSQLVELAKLGLQTQENPYAHLPEELQGIAKHQANGGDMATFLRWSTLNPDQMTDRELLWEKFKGDNIKQFGNDAELARRRFDREFSSKFAEAKPPEFEDDSEREEWEAENAGRNEERKDDLKWAVDQAKEFVNSQKVEFTTPNEGEEFTPEQREQVLGKHRGNVEEGLNDFEGIKVMMPDNKEFNIGLTEESKNSVSELIKHPDKYLEMVGLSDEDGFDIHRMAAVSLLVEAIESGSIGDLLTRFVVDNYNTEFLENKLENPAEQGRPSNRGGEGELSNEEEIAKAFRTKRENAERKRRFG